MEIDNVSTPVVDSAVEPQEPIADTSNPVSDVPLDSPQVPADNGKEPIEPAKEQELFDWTKDSRHKSMWKADPNQLYKSYKSLEGVYTPLKQTFDKYDKMLKELEIEPEQIKDIVTEYKSLKDPNNPMVSGFNYLAKWLQNPLYADKVQSFFNDLEIQENQRMFPNMSQEQIEKWKAREGELESLKEWQKQQQIKEESDKNYKLLESGFSKSKEYAKKKGFELPDDVINKVIGVMAKEEIPAKYFFQAFLEIYGDEIDKTFGESKEKKVISNLQKNKENNVVISAGHQSSPSKTEPSFRDKLKKAVSVFR